MYNKICFCIPARYNSKRLDKKLLLNLCNKTCISLTIEQVLKSKFACSENIYIFTDSQLIIDELANYNCNTVLTKGNYINGSERISKNIASIPDEYDIIVNIQADEPFISPINIDEAINKHINNNDQSIFYTTLHEENNSPEFLKSTASLKVVTDNHNNALYYSRNIIPWNKNNMIDPKLKYKTFTGIYVYNRKSITMYSDLSNTNLQNVEDCEQLKILEHGFKIKTYPTIEYNEISLNTSEDYLFLCKKY